MIYLIDDDQSIRRGFELFLKSAGLDLVSFENAEDFLSSVKTQPNDILILDLHLPGMSGCELLLRLEKDSIHIPVIVVTAFDEPQSRDACKQYGVKAYMRKPLDSEALLDIITYNLPEASGLNTENQAENDKFRVINS